MQAATGRARPPGGFEKLEAAVRETARGRDFLDEFARRVRASETGRLCEAVDRIGAATGELHCVLRSTGHATAEILTTAERLQALAGEFRGAGAGEALCVELETHATGLMVACSFHDLTGQRMTRVVNTLRYLEQRVNAPRDTRAGAHLLNGPAREGEAIAQADIDRLFG